MTSGARSAKSAATARTRHPDGNATGFTAVEYVFGGKYLELVKELAPGLKRAAVIRDPNISAGIGLFGAIQSVAPSLGVEVVPVNVRDSSEIERSIDAFAHGSNDGLIVTASALAFTTAAPLINTMNSRRLMDRRQTEDRTLSDQRVAFVVRHNKFKSSMSALGHSRPSHFVPVLNNVRYASDSDHSRYESELTLWAMSGHSDPFRNMAN
jgi:hypothetical protein